MILTDMEKHISESAPERIRARYRSLVEAAREGDFGELDEDVVVIDTETTGISFKNDELTQIAAARLCKGEIVGWYTTFVNPGKPIPEEIQHLTNIHDEDVEDAPCPAEALAGLVEFVGESDLVAHNAAFDKNFCTKHPAGYALKRNLWLDSLDLARISLPKLKSHRLIDLVKTFGAPVSTHRADDDVVATCAVFRILLAAVAAMPAELVSYIAHCATREEWPTVKVFQVIDAANEGERKRFSLRSIRQEHVGSKMARPRIDADKIASDPVKSLDFPSSEEVSAAFAPDGMMGSIYDDFETREAQRQMACEVASAFEASVNLAVEAGTGVGKSMAYLIPSVMLAMRNEITVGVATKTNALLDQLVNHELPLLAKQNEGLSFCSLKGFSHYPCLRNIERLVNEGPKMRMVNDVEVSQAAALAGLLSFIEQSDYDDIDGLKIDYRALPRYEICTSSHDCLRRKCPFFGSKCFVHGARQRAESADIVVTNQTMLFCDVAAEGGLLPPVRYWVIDESHGTEDEARRAFSCSIEADELRRIANRVGSAEASRNVFLRTERTMTGKTEASEETVRAMLRPEELEEAKGTGNNAGDTLLFALCSRALKHGREFDQAARDFCDHIGDLLFFDPVKRSKGYDRVELWLNDDIRQSYTFAALVSYGRVMCDAAEHLVKSSQELVGYLEGVEGAAALQREIASTAMTLKEVVNAAEVILFDGSPLYAYAAHLSRKKQSLERLEALMLDVGDAMNENFFARVHSAVFTSATMTIADSFDSFERGVGLGRGEFSQCRTCRLDSEYDFDSNMTVYVAEDMPEPNDPGYMDALCDLLIGVHRAQGGSTLTLFTNRKEMEKSHAVVQAAVRGDDLRIICQRWGVSIKGLRDDFIADEHLSLFALKSFWEGFDAPGSTLKTVVVPKLPFNKPTDPLSCERAQIDPQAWAHYVLPAAVLEVRQAAGRLIRSSTDTGNLVLADRRLVSKRYGSTFLKSLPSKNIRVLPMRRIIEELS